MAVAICSKCDTVYVVDDRYNGCPKCGAKCK